MKTARILLAAAALTGAAAPALAGDWKFLPVTEKGYAPARCGNSLQVEAMGPS